MRNDGRLTADWLAAKRRWALVKEREEEERRTRTPADKLDEVERLMESIDDFGWRAMLDDDAPVRARWNELRRRFCEKRRAAP